MTNCEVITKTDIQSDHRLVRMTLRINKSLARLKTIKKQKRFINTQKLKGMKEILEINLKTDLKQLEEEVTATNLSEIMKEDANKFAGKTKEEPPVLSTEDRGKELRKKEDGPERER